MYLQNGPPREDLRCTTVPVYAISGNGSEMVAEAISGNGLPEAPIFHFLTDGKEKGRIRHFREKVKNPSFSLRDGTIRFFCLHMRPSVSVSVRVCVNVMTFFEAVHLHS